MKTQDLVALLADYLTANDWGVPLGGSATSGVSLVHLSKIQNVETIVHLHYLEQTIGGVDRGELVIHTASMKYADTTAIQTGYERSDLPVVLGGDCEPIRDILEWQERGNAGRVADNNAILSKYGFTRDTVMYVSFDIDLAVRPKP